MGLLDRKLVVSLLQVDCCKEVVCRNQGWIEAAGQLGCANLFSILSTPLRRTFLREGLGEEELSQSIMRLRLGSGAEAGESFFGFVLLGRLQSLRCSKKLEMRVEMVGRLEIVGCLLELT